MKMLDNIQLFSTKNGTVIIFIASTIIRKILRNLRNNLINKNKLSTLVRLLVESRPLTEYV